MSALAPAMLPSVRTPMALRGVPVDDRVDPLGRDAELDREVDVAGAEGVDERVEAAAAGVADALGDAVAVGHRDHAVLAQPVVVGLAGEADDGRAGAARELDGERADAAGGAGDRDDVAVGERHGAHGGPGGGADHEQRAGDLPRHRRRGVA